MKNFKNDGFQLVQIIADTKCFTASRKQRAMDFYCDSVKSHGGKIGNHVLAQLLAQNAIENV